mmetsp:Transcript_20723/g.28609  ORF Transcript_20723/g.28609 Transcript_20723/m.28609 type:complete len:245 (+) Transcript_20723:75-809(+)
MLSRSLQQFSVRPVHPCPNPDAAFFLGPKFLPYKVAPVPGNPYAFLEHDGVSEGYQQGFRPRDIHWLYRWRHNLNPRCRAVGRYTSQNPMGLQVHWLENTTTIKVARHVFSEECFPHLMCWLVVSAYTLWHCWWYLYEHPDVTMRHLAMWMTKPYVTFCRNDELHPMEKPVFRYFQGTNEFYLPQLHRELVNAGVVVNDPWLEYCKDEGIFDELKKYPNELNGRQWPPKTKTKKEKARKAFSYY